MLFIPLRYYKQTRQHSGNKVIFAPEKTDRIIYADLLRILAIFAVVVIHVSMSNWKAVPENSFERGVFSIYEAAASFAIPVFVMISGMFMLDPRKNIGYKDIFKKYLFRIVSAFVFWSACYAIIMNIWVYGEAVPFNLRSVLKAFLAGHYHLWFLYMLAGLYLVTPLLRKVVARDRKATEYFLVLSAVFTVILPALAEIPVLADLRQLPDSLHFNYTTVYAGYFVGGYYLKTCRTGKLTRIIIYLLGIAALSGNIIFTDLLQVEWFAQVRRASRDSFIPNVLLSVGVFVFFKYEVSRIKFKGKSLIMVSAVSSLVFGIYLVHEFTIQLFRSTGFTTTNFNAVLSVPIISISVFITSLLLVFCISKIPFLKDYII